MGRYFSYIYKILLVIFFSLSIGVSTIFVREQFNSSDSNQYISISDFEENGGKIFVQPDSELAEKDIVEESPEKISEDLDLNTDLELKHNDHPKIPAITSNYFDNLSGENLTNINADHLGGLAESSFLKSDRDDWFEAQLTITGAPKGPLASDAPLYINPNSSGNNDALFGIAYDDTELFKVTSLGDVSIARDINISGVMNSTSGHITGNLTVDGTITGDITGTISPGLTEGSVAFIDSAGNFDEDNSNFYWDNVNNRLGIGTGGPNFSLHIQNSSGVDVVGLGIGGNPYIYNTTGTPTLITGDIQGGGTTSRFGGVSARHNIAGEEPYGLVHSDNGTLTLGGGRSTINSVKSIRFNTSADGLVTTGTIRAIITGDGDFGIGTTTPNDKLEILSASDSQLRLAYDTSNYSAFQVASDGGLTYSALGTDADLNFDFSGATDGDFSVNTDDLFVDTSSGNVGIGVTTTSGTLSIKDHEVADDIVLDIGNNFRLIRENDDTANNIGDYTFQAKSNSQLVDALRIYYGGVEVPNFASPDIHVFSTGIDSGAEFGINFANSGFSSAVYEFRLTSEGRFFKLKGDHTNTNPSWPDTYLVIENSSGNVGIGDNSPAAHLVIGDDTGAGFADGTGDVYIQNDLEVDGNLYVNGTTVDESALWENTSNAFHPLGSYAGVADVLIGGTATSSASIRLASDGSAVFNERGNDADFRIEGDTEQNLFFADASAGEIGVGTNAPDARFEVYGKGGAEVPFWVKGGPSQNGDFMRITDSTGVLEYFSVAPNSGFVFNELGGANVDFRIEGDTDTNLFFTDASTDRVGIGTDSPTSKLQVNDGNITVTGTNRKFIAELTSGSDTNFASLWTGTTLALFQYPDDIKFGIQAASGQSDSGSSGYSMMSFGSTRNTMFGDMSASQADPGHRVTIKGSTATDSNAALSVLNSSDTSLLYVRNDGYVGIGTASPDSLLNITDNGGLNNTPLVNIESDNDALIHLDSGGGADDYSQIRFRKSGVTVAELFTQANTDDDIYLRGTGTSDLVLMNTGGNVGIGTTSPSSLLHLVGDSGTGGALTLDSTTANANTQLEFRDSGTQKWAISKRSNNDLWLAYDFTNAATRIVVSNDGDVGIGTDSPTSKLHAVTSGTSGTDYLFEDNTGGSLLEIKGSGSNNAILELNRNDASTWSLIVDAVGGDDLTFKKNALEYVRFQDIGGAVFNETGAATTDFRIEGDTDPNLFFVDAGTDRVGIGTGSPSKELEVSGDTLVTGTLTVGNGASSLSQDSNATRLHGTSDIKFTVWNGAILEAMRIETGSGNIGIGTDTPVHRLHLTGTYAGNALMAINETGGNDIFTASASGTTKFTIQNSGLTDASVDGVATLVNAGAITDGSYTGNAVDGLLGVDSSNGRLYFRYGGAWHYTAQTAGFQIPNYESFAYDFDSKTFNENIALKEGDFLIPFVESTMEDGAKHGLYARFDDVKDTLFADVNLRIEDLSSKYQVLSSKDDIEIEELDSRIRGNDGEYENFATLAEVDQKIADVYREVEKDFIKKSEIDNHLSFGERIINIFSEVVFKAKATYQASVEYIADVTFRGSVSVNADTAGEILIPADTKKFRITFDNKYSQEPIVYISVSDGSDVDVVVTNVTTEYFEAEVDPTINKDFKIKWLALISDTKDPDKLHILESSETIQDMEAIIEDSYVSTESAEILEAYEASDSAEIE